MWLHDAPHVLDKLRDARSNVAGSQPDDHALWNSVHGIGPADAIGNCIGRLTWRLRSLLLARTSHVDIR